MGEVVVPDCDVSLPVKRSIEQSARTSRQG